MSNWISIVFIIMGAAFASYMVENIVIDILKYRQISRQVDEMYRQTMELIEKGKFQMSAGEEGGVFPPEVKAKSRRAS